MEQSVEQVRARGKRLTRAAVSVDSQITQGRVSGAGEGKTGACRPSRSASKTPRDLPFSLSIIFPFTSCASCRCLAVHVKSGASLRKSGSPRGQSRTECSRSPASVLPAPTLARRGQSLCSRQRSPRIAGSLTASSNSSRAQAWAQAWAGLSPGSKSHRPRIP